MEESVVLVLAVQEQPVLHGKRYRPSEQKQLQLDTIVRCIHGDDCMAKFDNDFFFGATSRSVCLEGIASITSREPFLACRAEGRFA